MGGQHGGAGPHLGLRALPGDRARGAIERRPGRTAENFYQDAEDYYRAMPATGEGQQQGQQRPMTPADTEMDCGETGGNNGGGRDAEHRDGESRDGQDHRNTRTIGNTRTTRTRARRMCRCTRRRSRKSRSNPATNNPHTATISRPTATTGRRGLIAASRGPAFGPISTPN